MTLASLLFALICALLVGSLFHLWVDGGLARLALYLSLSLTGFAAGQWLGHLGGLRLLPVGPLDLGLATLGSLLLLGLGHWLSLVRVERRGRDDKV
jgi:hypothetical protein